MMQAKYDFAPCSKQQSGVQGSWSIYEAALVGTFLSHQKNQGTNDGKSPNLNSKTYDRTGVTNCSY